MFFKDLVDFTEVVQRVISSTPMQHDEGRTLSWDEEEAFSSTSLLQMHSVMLFPVYHVVIRMTYCDEFLTIKTTCVHVFLFWKKSVSLTFTVMTFAGNSQDVMD